MSFVPQRKLLEPEEETEEEKQFRVIFKKISGEVSSHTHTHTLDDTDDSHSFSLHQDMQICANELKGIMKNVLDKRNHAAVVSGSSAWKLLINHTLFPQTVK